VLTKAVGGYAAIFVSLAAFPGKRQARNLLIAAITG
jgi:hypothetical protein